VDWEAAGAPARGVGCGREPSRRSRWETTRQVGEPTRRRGNEGGDEPVTAPIQPVSELGFGRFGFDQSSPSLPCDSDYKSDGAERLSGRPRASRRLPLGLLGCAGLGLLIRELVHTLPATTTMVFNCSCSQDRIQIGLTCHTLPSNILPLF